MAINFSAYDSHKTLSLSEAAHLWVEMTPVANRGGVSHPGPDDSGWKYVFWRWLKEQINQLNSPTHYPKGYQKFPRKLYLEIAKSKEYAALVDATSGLKLRPLFLFPEDRSNLGPAKASAEGKCRQWLIEKMQGVKENPKAGYLEKARILFNCSKPQFERAWRDANAETGSGWDQGGRPRKN